MNKIAIFLLELYQRFISPLIGGKSRCKFIPTCSEYSKEAYQNYNFLKASLLTAKRLLKCHPWNKHSGYDPLIKKEEKRK
jgi:putative membrane protein insertion efficiency factor